ncbi:MAG: MBL fold metallo-hydrolase, partial [Acidobacteriota bacterium]
ERFWLLPSEGGEKPLSIGMPWPEAYLTSRGANFRWQSAFAEIAPNIFITGEVPRQTSFETGSPKFIINRNGRMEPDPFLDDYSLAVKTSEGLVVVLGCAHAGTINVLDHLIEKTGEDRVRAVLGGTHLGFSSDDQLDETIAALKRYRVHTLAVSHCTGQKPIARLAAEFRENFAFGCVGFTLSS